MSRRDDQHGPASEFARRRRELFCQLRADLEDVRGDVVHAASACARQHAWLYLGAGVAAGALFSGTSHRRQLAALAASAIRMAELGRLTLS